MSTSPAPSWASKRRSWGAVGLGSARHLAEYFHGARRSRLAHLCRLALAVRRYSRIAVNHGLIMQ